MDLNIREETWNVKDWTWLGSRQFVSAAKDVTVLVAGATEATHYPDGIIKAGTLLAQYSGGANDGLWAPYVHDHSGGFDLDTARAIVLSGFKLAKDSNGSYTSTKVAGAALHEGQPIEVIVANLPGLLDDVGAAYAPLAADLPASFFDLSGR